MEAGAACRRRYELRVTDQSAPGVGPPDLMDLDLMDPVDRWYALAGAERGDGRQKLGRSPRAALDRRDTRSPDRPRIGSTSCDSRLAPKVAAADPAAD